MKKLLAIVLAVLSAFSMTAVAYAENTTTLTTTVPDATYTLNIPADQEVEFNAQRTPLGIVTVTNAEGFSVGKNLSVTLTYAPFSSPSTSTTIPFKVKLDPGSGTVAEGTILSGDKLTFEGKNDGTVGKASTPGTGVVNSLIVEINSADWGKALGGDYSATITFTAEVVVKD